MIRSRRTNILLSYGVAFLTLYIVYNWYHAHLDRVKSPEDPPGGARREEGADPTHSRPCSSESRAQALKDMCAEGKYNTYTNVTHGYFFVNEKYKYVACIPPKCGSNTWRTIMVNNTLDKALKVDQVDTYRHGMARFGIVPLVTYPKFKVVEILKNYFKFMIVRHPLDRLVSAYNDKVVLGQLPAVRRNVLKVGAGMFNASGPDLRAFLEYTLLQPNEHWIPAAHLCDACNVQYDSIVKLETQSHDVREIIPHLGPHARAMDTHANKKGNGAAKEFTWSLPAFGNITSSLLHKVLDHGFQYDLKLFGYSWSTSPHGNFTAHCSYPHLQCC